MPNNNSNINLPRIGMNTDSRDVGLQRGEYSFMLNGAIEDFDGGTTSIQNMGSNRLQVVFPTGYFVIGRKYVMELGLTLFMLTTTNGHSEIGYIKDCSFNDSTEDIPTYSNCENCPDNLMYKENVPLETTTQLPYCTYITLTNNDCLGFNINNPVEIEYRITQYGLNVYFTDALNPLRFIYFNLVNGSLQLQDRFKVVTGFDPDNCDVPIHSNVLDCNKIRYNPDYSRPCIEAVAEALGGGLKAGSYQALVCYADSLGNPLTHYFAATPIVSIKTKNITVETNYLTDKAITFNINNLEQSDVFTNYNIVIVETIDNFTTFKLADTLPITQTTYTYTGLNAIRDLTANDVFFERAIYQNANSITKANDFLFYSGMKEYNRLNLQQAVNRIQAFWQTKNLPEHISSDAIEANEYRGYMRDEVYPLAVVFELIDDNDTIAFPLVGPSKAYFQTVYGIDVDQVVSNNDVITDPSCEATVLNKKWQVYNVAQIVGTPHQQSTDCQDSNCWEYGDFSYWESEENYPNIPEIWGDVCGQPIRHFKFPDSSVTHIHDGLGGSNTYTNSNRVLPMGIKVVHASVGAALDWAVTNNLITASQRARIKGYRLVRGNRFGNKSITAKGLLYDIWHYSKYGNTYYYPNYPYNDLTQDVFIAPDASTYNGSNTSNPHPTQFNATRRYTFHSPDIHFTNTSLGNILKLEADEYGQSEGYFNYADEQSKYRLLSTVSRTLCFGAGIAAAFSSITRECRTIEKQRQFISELGVASGNANWFLDDAIFRYNTLLSPTPEILPAGMTVVDCKGTTYQWLSPLHIAAMAGEEGTVAGIMAGIVLLGEGVSNALYLFTIMLKEIDTFSNLIKALTPKKNLAIQYNSIGKYNNYLTIANNTGNKLRLLDKAAYLTTDNQTLSESDTSFIRINNWNRESSVFLKTDSTKPLLPSPSYTDNSRVTMDNAGLGYGDLNKRFNRNVSSYYVSLKNYLPSQYGSIYNIQYLETSGCSTQFTDTVSECRTYFGGDTFISRFALKRKLPFFIQNRFRQLDEADVEYSLLGNVGFPNFYFDAGEGIMEKLSSLSIGDIFTNLGGFFQDLVGTDDSRMDAKTAKFFYQNGYIHLYSYGIPYFLVESDVNTSFRNGENQREKDFYPDQQDLDFWFQEKNVPITEDNYYFYNKSYSKQNKESSIKTVKPDYLKFTTDTYSTFNGRIIYTEKNKTLSENDNWLIIKANNFFDVDTSNGRVTSVDGIEQDKVLVRNENTTQIFNAYDLIKMQTGTLQVGDGGIFEGRVKDFVVSPLGYMASQHRSLLQTEFGHVWADAKRGNVFLLGSNASSMEEISRNGMRNWFRENLPFQILKDFPTINYGAIDNNYKGLGLHLSFDKRFSRFFLTKLDYKCINSDVIVNGSDFYLGETKLSLNDTAYFKNMSWTISYSFLTKTWTSYHSFLPNFYVDYIGNIASGLNNFQSNSASLWSHDVTNKSYQVYYGVLYPFTIDIVSTQPANPYNFNPPESTPNVVNSVAYVNDAYRYHNKYDWFNNRQITFNKAVVYNELQNTGLLNLLVKDENNLSDITNYPKVNGKAIDIQVANSNGLWQINDLSDSVNFQLNNLPLWLKDQNNVDKQLNFKAFDYFKKDADKASIRSRLTHIRLTNDQWSNYKFIFLLNQFNQYKDYR